jgi:hypothetical protein
MRIRKTIVGGVAAVMLFSGGLLATAGAASAATNTGNGQQQCSSLFWNISSDQASLHVWQLQRVADAGHGLNINVDDAAIEFYFNQIEEDGQALTDAGC